MFGKYLSKNIVLNLTSFVAMLVACHHANAQAFKVSGEGVAEYLPLPGEDPAMHFAVGNATHLGDYFGIGALITEGFTGPASAEFASAVPFVFFAANGDQLAFHYGREDLDAEEPGVVDLFPAEEPGKVFAVFTAEFNPVPELCTGRFQKVVDGSFIMIAVSEPFVLGAKDPTGYSWEGDGWIQFRKGKK